MKVARVAGIALALVCAGAARNKDNNKPAETRGENESVVITATVYAKPEAVKEVIGSDLGGHYIVVAVEVTPRFGKQVAIDRDDFVLKTDKDGERTGPFAPSQIAGRRRHGGASDGRLGATPMHDNDGPIWGGYPGSMGQPRRLGGDGVGSAGAPDGAEAKTRTGSPREGRSHAGGPERERTAPNENRQACFGAAVFPHGKAKSQRPGTALQHGGRQDHDALPRGEMMRTAEVDTPALLVDLDVMERNLRRVADYAGSHGLRLRPHTKTHKSPRIGRRQLDLGAAGLTVAKVGEAEVMLDASPADLLVAYPVIGPAKLDAPDGGRAARAHNGVAR